MFYFMYEYGSEDLFSAHLSLCWRRCAPQEDKIAVIVATVTDDARLFEVPKLRVCALKFTETARARIVKVRPGEARVGGKQQPSAAGVGSLGWKAQAGLSSGGERFWQRSRQRVAALSTLQQAPGKAVGWR